MLKTELIFLFRLFLNYRTFVKIILNLYTSIDDSVEIKLQIATKSDTLSRDR